MKQFFRFFTLLLVAVVTSVSAWAQIEIPMPNAVAPELGKEYFILHVGTQKFVGQGEAWAHQAVVSEEGLKFVLLNAREDGGSIGVDADGEDVFELPNGQYWIKCPEKETAPTGQGAHLDRFVSESQAGNDVYCVFPDGKDYQVTGIWQLASLGGNIYTLQVPSAYNFETDGSEDTFVEGQFWGAKFDHYSLWAESHGGVTNGLYYDVVYDEAPEMCQFQFLPADEMAAYNLKRELVALIETAKELGVGTTDAEAVVANPNATVEEVQAAIDALTEALKGIDEYNFPEDVTDGYIVPAIPLPGDSDGWTMLDADGNPVDFQCNFTSGENIGELWQKGGYSIKYTIKDLPAGVYTLRVQGWTRTGMTSVIKAGDVEKKLVTVDFNSRAEGRTQLDNGNLVNDLKFFQNETGDVEISLVADNTTGDHWTCWSKWSLLSHGDAAESYKKAAIDAVKGWESEFLKEDEVGNLVPKNPFTQSYFDAVGTIANSFNDMTTKDQVQQGLDNFYAALQSLRDNISLYQALLDNINQDDPYNDYGGYPKFVDVYNEVDDIFVEEDFTKTNEQLEDLLARYEQLREEAKNWLNTDYEVGDIVTTLIENPKFKTKDGKASSFEGWTVASSSWFENNVGSLSIVEQWANGTQMGVIDVYQEIAPPKVGVYVLKSKGWYRSTNIPNRLTEPGYNTVNTYLYGASSEYPFHDIYDRVYTLEEKAAYFPMGSVFNPYHDGDSPMLTAENDIEKLADMGYEYVLPQNPTAADELFNNPEVTWYDMECRFLGLGSDMPVKIGVRGRDIPPYAWLIWDDFQLVYESDKLDDMAAVASAVAVAAQEDVDGFMATKTKNALLDCIDGLENPENVDQLIDCYKRIDDARAAARNSKKLYQQLQDKRDELDNALFDYSQTATSEAYAAADALSAEMDEAIKAGSIDDEDVPAALQRMNEAISRLKIPDVTGASDDNLIDFTAVITNPKYFDGNAVAATSEGWTDGGGFVASNYLQNVGDVIGLAEGWANSFDVYQDLTNMPEGTYEVRVWGLFRQNTYPKDAKLSLYEYAVKEGKEDALSEEDKTDLVERAFRGKFYANNDSAAFQRWNFMGTSDWTFDAQSDFNVSTSGGDYTVKDSVTIGREEDEILEYYFPGDRASAYERFAQGYYENVLYTYVSEKGNLRIGACNKAHEESDWVTFTNWRLFYRGTESVFEEGTGIREMETDSKTVVDGIYTIDGRKTQKLQKGMNIVVSDGKARKIMVK